MLLLSFIAIGVVGLVFVKQFNKRLIDLKLELVKTTQDLKQKIEKLEQKISGKDLPTPTTTTHHSEPILKRVFTPDPIPWKLQESQSKQTTAPKPSDDQRFSNDDFSSSDMAYKPDALSDFFDKIKNYIMTGNT